MKEEFDQRADELDAEADALEEKSDDLEEDVSNASQDWEAKKSDDSIAGAQPDEDDSQS